MEETQSVQKFREHLADNGYEYNALDKTYRVPASSGDPTDPSPDYLDNSPRSLRLRSPVSG